MHGQSALRRQSDAAAAADDDPFADLLAPDEAPLEQEEVLSADDREVLRTLFADIERPRSAAHRAPVGSPWPDHNFGPAYDSLHRQRRPRLLPHVLAESDVWDVDRITSHESAPPVDPARAEPPAWRAPPAGDAASSWLDALAGADDTSARSTEARLVDVVWGRPTETTVVEVDEVLHARPRAAPLVRGQVRAAAPRPFPRSLEVAGLAVLLLFALAVLQLLLS